MNQSEKRNADPNGSPIDLGGLGQEGCAEACESEPNENNLRYQSKLWEIKGQSLTQITSPMEKYSKGLTKNEWAEADLCEA